MPIERRRLFYKSATLCGLAGVCYLVLVQVLFVLAQALLYRITGPNTDTLAGEIWVGVFTLLVSLFSLGGTIVAVLRLGPRHVRYQLYLQPPKRQLLSFFIPAFLFVVQGSNLLAALLRTVTETSSSLDIPQGDVAILLWLVYICLLPAVGEELLFRGVLQGLLRPFGAWLAIVAQALVFALLHSEISQCLVAFLCALFFGWMAQVTGSIRTGIALHLMNNSIAALQIWLVSQNYIAAANLVILLLYGVVPVWAAVALISLLRSGKGSLLRLPQGELSPVALVRVPGFVLCVAVLLAFCLLQNFVF